MHFQTSRGSLLHFFQQFTWLRHCFIGLQICSLSLCVCTVSVQQSFTQRLHALRNRPALPGRLGLGLPAFAALVRALQRVSELHYYMSSQQVSPLRWPIYYWHSSCALVVYRNFVRGQLYAHGRFSYSWCVRQESAQEMLSPQKCPCSMGQSSATPCGILPGARGWP